MSQIAESLTNTEKLQLEMIENEFNACMSTQASPTRETFETPIEEAKANSAVVEQLVDYITSSSLSSSFSSIESGWTTTTAESSVILSETASEEPTSTAVNSKSCCNTKELPSPITSKYAYDETTFLSSTHCNGNNSVMEIADTSKTLHNCNGEHKGANKGKSNSSMNTTNKTFLCSDNDKDANDSSETSERSCVEGENVCNMREGHDELVDLSEDEKMENVAIERNVEREKQRKENDNDDEDCDEEDDDCDEEDDNASWAERQRATLMRMRLHILPQANIPDKFKSNTVTFNEGMRAKEQVLLVNNKDNKESANLADKVVTTNLTQESNVCDSSNDISPTHSSLYTTQPHVSNISGISPLKEEYASYISTGINNEKDDNTEINKEFSVVDVNTNNEETGDNVNEVPEIKKMISQLLEELRTREKSVQRADSLFHIPGSDKYWRERVARRREQLQREVEEQKLHECTFHPSISPGSRAIATLREQNYSNLNECNKTTNNNMSASATVNGYTLHKNDKNKQESVLFRNSDTTTLNNSIDMHRKSVYDRLYKLAENSKTESSKKVHRHENDSIDAWRKHCSGFVSSTSHIANSKTIESNRSRIMNPTENVIENTEMRLFLSNMLNCNINETMSFDDLIRHKVAVRTKYVSPMSQAFAELKQSQSIHDTTYNNSGNVDCDSNCNRDQHSNKQHEEFSEFWRRQQGHLARKARTVQVVKNEITPEFKPHTTHKSNVIIQRLLLEDEKSNNHTNQITQPSILQVSECEPHLFAWHHSASLLSKQNELSHEEQHNKLIVEQVKHAELPDAELCNQRSKRQDGTVLLNTELIRRRKHEMRGAKENENKCTFRPMLSKGTKRLLSSSNRYKLNFSNHSELTNCTGDGAAKENVVISSDMLNSDVKEIEEKSHNINKMTNNNTITDVVFVPNDTVTNKESKSNSNTLNRSKDVHNGVNVQSNVERSTTVNENGNITSSSKCNSHKRFEELYAQHERILRSRVAARERKANEEVLHLTFKPNINNYCYSSSARVRECKSKLNHKETCDVDKEQVHQEELSEDVEKAHELKEEREYHVTSMLSKEKRKQYVEIVTKRQQEREEKRAAMLHEREKAELSQCTFKPQLTRLPEYIPRMRTNGESVRAVQQPTKYCNLQQYRV